MQRPVVQGMVDMEPDVVLHTGDIVHAGEFDQYRNYYFSIASPLTSAVPHIYVAGNHEEEGEAIPFDAYFPIADRVLSSEGGEELPSGPRTGWYDVGAARFFLLDSEKELDTGSPQLAQRLAVNMF